MLADNIIYVDFINKRKQFDKEFVEALDYGIKQYMQEYKQETKNDKQSN